ncbi:MAG TPA: NADH-quinone oxidoreductase subunit C, partial [Flavobacteriaceae bacterium]|nr:NADH-quinone oxidoreductase subunit C [Flavobacteriaceae bacterium]
MVEKNEVISDIEQKFEGALLTIQKTADKFPTLWIAPENIIEVIAFLKNEIALPYEMLYDLTAIDEQAREHREGQPESVFTLVYTLLSFSRNEYLRLKVPTLKTEPTVDSLTSVFPVANWYEREVYDMFGIKFNGHPN